MRFVYDGGAVYKLTERNFKRFLTAGAADGSANASDFGTYVGAGFNATRADAEDYQEALDALPHKERVTAARARTAAELTADTLTEQQIHDLRLQLAREMQEALPHARTAQAAAMGATGLQSFEELHADFKSCETALGRVRISHRHKGYKRAARERVVETLKARAARQP
jgi:hypothetical protein